MFTFRWINTIKDNRKKISVTLLLVVIGSDQYTKYLAGKLFEASSEMSFFNSFFKFSFIRNYGGFLGIVNNLPENYKFFLLYVCVFFLLLGCLVYLFGFKRRSIRYELPLVFVTGGGMSNLLDRLLHNGGVTDFLSIGVGTFRTGILNLADIYILFGSFILGYFIFASTPNSTHPTISKS